MQKKWHTSYRLGRWGAGLVLHGPVFGSGGVPEVAFVKSCWKLPARPAEPVPDGSEHAAGQNWAN